ncbi:UvrD-helicase domain-containing protein [Nocardia canadensis]|uniref:UvrD-helicase domain-containing protein n=1 Tax=Nocardia canadensis TaxID=3065238 RepID=UPI00292FE698|nr:UvrD-helicase domain-containing protein [Nocardia canadensis]
MSDISRHRRAHWAEQQIAAHPQLTASQRRFLSAILIEPRWHLLLDTTPPTPDRAAAFAIGRSGVFALIFTDTVPADQVVRGIRRTAEEMFANLLFDRAQFVPHTLELVLLMQRRVPTEAHDPFLTADEATIRDTLLTRERLLSPSRAATIAATVATRVGASFTSISTDDAPTPETVATDGLFDSADLDNDTRSASLTRPFREWITFLDPEQLALVHANFTGPARFSGPAGTGKSVVALHRMAHFAKRNPGRLLFTSFVRTLPTYHRSGFARIAPTVVDRTEFIGLHAWATGFLKSRKVTFHLDVDAADDAMARTWMGVRHRLDGYGGTDFTYWEEEIKRVIKGRGLTTLDEYRAIERSGRDGLRLTGRQREYVWDNLFLPYQQRLADKQTHDFNDVIALATDELRQSPFDDDERYSMVVVDEVQDCTLMELRLVHRIAGGTDTDQLLLVGDGQQQVYPGGWRLSDAGIPLAGGRGRVLRTNYRNRAAVLDLAKQLEAGNTVDDLDGGRGFVLRDSDGTLPDGAAVKVRLRRDELDAAFLHAVRDCGVPTGEIAVIVDTHRDAKHCRDLLHAAGLPTMALDDYNGTQLAEIKIGTVHRAKGMDFAAVFHITTEPATFATVRGATRDRAELAARQKLVAVTRARDYAWLAYITDQ